MGQPPLHGARIIEDDSGARPIRTVSSAVIGIAFTAPDAEPATTASLTVGTGDSGLTFAAQTTGAQGNALAVRFVNPQANDAALAVSVIGQVISVSLATNASGSVVTTADDVKTAIEGNTEAAGMVAVTLTGNGSGAVDAEPLAYFTGGQDEPFPLNKPVSFTANARQKLAKMGTTGTGPWIIPLIARYGGHLIVGVRVADGGTEQQTRANIAGSASALTGIWALLKAQTVTGYTPRIIGAPGFTQDQSVANEVIAATKRLNGYCYIDCVNQVTEENALAYRKQFGSEFGMLLHTWWRERTANGGEVQRPLSTYMLGARARQDIQRGWHWVVSNTPVEGGLGPVIDVDFKLNDPATLANRLNQNHITTVVNTGAGYVFWGCRSMIDDPKKVFENWGRAKGIIYDSLIGAHQWAMDRNITSTYTSDVQEGVQNFLDRLKAGQYIIDGECWVDEEMNTPDSIALGQFYWDFDYM
ncbi:phage tail sheath subtilisin-like domain-containing protein, partial [Sansalvadorimonas verongulae]|uniref:phage tail sheath subtilisin-like domain-containing protein n=1 Tax=Sansalvadorimonas verongulae TaxID=2172824 RepID=UPI0012BC0BFF